jgi:hypothetical protein
MNLPGGALSSGRPRAGPAGPLVEEVTRSWRARIAGRYAGLPLRTYRRSQTSEVRHTQIRW